MPKRGCPGPAAGARMHHARRAAGTPWSASRHGPMVPHSTPSRQLPAPGDAYSYASLGRAERILPALPPTHLQLDAVPVPLRHHADEQAALAGRHRVGAKGGRRRGAGAPHRAKLGAHQPFQLVQRVPAWRVGWG